MNSRIIAISVFFILFLGIQVQSFAQASASVSYTIVVSEEMFAENNRGFENNSRSGMYRFQENNQPQAPSSVAVSMHAGFDGDNMETLASFETELSTEQAPLVRDVLQEQIASAESQPDVTNYYSDNDQYLVVLEYN